VAEVERRYGSQGSDRRGRARRGADPGTVGRTFRNEGLPPEGGADERKAGAQVSHPGVDMISAYLAESGFTDGSIADQRSAMAEMAPSPPPEGVSVEPVTLGGRDAEWLTPDFARSNSAGSDSVVLYLHGGGYCIGSLDTHRGLGGRLAIAAGCPVAVLDYRLAPEHPFPAAVDDACGAYHDLLALGVRPERIAIAGDSAGGGLTVATLLALRAAGVALPAAAACLSPWTDLTQSSAAFAKFADLDPMVSKSGLDLMAGAYLGDADPRNELASPLFAADLGGLPPVCIEVGEYEVLLDDATGLAERLADAGVEAPLTVWPELIHVFQAFPGSVIPEADVSIAAVGSFLAGHLRAAPAAAGADDRH
jgi:monoterpene epsilon-lactone hydrolase